VRAVWLKELGGPEVLVPGDAPEPEVGPEQVLVDVAFAGITFVETQMRATGFGPFPLELPMIPGNGVSGVVSVVGERTDRSLLGARVVTSTGGSGGYAEQVAVDAAALHAVPAALALDDAAAVLADGRTAVLQREAAGVGTGDRVLVTAAAGGVGSLLVQLCRAAGGVVIGVVGGPEKVAVVRDLAADLVVDHRWEGWPDQVRDMVGGVDVVLDGVGGELARSAFGLLEPGGRLVSFGAASGAFAAIDDVEAVGHQVTVIRPGRPDPERVRLATDVALGEVAAGRLRPVIGQRFPLDQAARAHRGMESRTAIGKTLLVVHPELDDERR